MEQSLQLKIVNLYKLGLNPTKIIKKLSLNCYRDAIYNILHKFNITLRGNIDKRILRKCRKCGKEFYKPLCRIRSGGGVYCSKKCLNNRSSKMINCRVCGEKIKLFLSRINSDYAYYCSKECWNKENKMGKIINCLHCNKSIYVQPCKFKTKKYCSKKCVDLHRSILMKGKLVGEKNPSWKGGVTPVKRKIRNSPEWKEWRTKIFERDNYTCQRCYSENCLLHPHHLNPFKFSRIINYLKNKYGIDKLYKVAMNYEPLWSPSIGVTLCVSCHKKTKGYASKL